MAAGKRIYRGNDARKRILEGMLEVSKSVSSTYGPQGRTVAFDRGGNVKITKDGITVAREIKFTDEAKNFGAMLIKEAAGKSNYLSGDGSSSTTILTAELCKEAYQLLCQGIDINDLKSGFRKATEKTLQYLVDYKFDIDTIHDTYKIALISANGDEEIAKNVQEAFSCIGDNGIVSLADSMSRKGESSVKTSMGLEFERGFLSSLSVNAANDQCILNDAHILLCSRPQNSVDDLKIILQPCQLNKIPVVIIAPDFDDEVMAWFREMLSKKQITGSLVLAPGASKQNIAERLEDLAVVIDATILDDINDYKFEFLGKVKQIIISKGKTTIIEPYTNEERFDKYVNLLKAKVQTDTAEIGYSEYEIEGIRERIAKMTGGVATIYIGALTAPELGEKKDRYEDAVNSVRAALQEGMVIGGGTPLLRISYNEDWGTCSLAENEVIKCYKKAIRVTAKTLIKSSGGDPEVIIPSIMSNDNNVGYDAKDRKVANLREKGIVDPYKVIKNSIIYASNVAEAFMQLDNVIVTDVPNMRIESLDSVLNEDGVVL